MTWSYMGWFLPDYFFVALKVKTKTSGYKQRKQSINSYIRQINILLIHSHILISKVIVSIFATFCMVQYINSYSTSLKKKCIVRQLTIDWHLWMKDNKLWNNIWRFAQSYRLLIELIFIFKGFEKKMKFFEYFLPGLPNNTKWPVFKS